MCMYTCVCVLCFCVCICMFLCVSVCSCACLCLCVCVVQCPGGVEDREMRVRGWSRRKMPPSLNCRASWGTWRMGTRESCMTPWTACCLTWPTLVCDGRMRVPPSTWNTRSSWPASD
ncbi:hypothetical protein AAFF_G00440560 [Aldrovandia affinis]|uniref:Secreted protein n=1 Tax=Aldrovandia affinis TaxID=143900 RepID=A0AAD7S7P4_9TELE|nr:hypothetical protein AAFF_G00440560 [Aldrovandia affinis]